ncbi:hypothetical protein COY25_03215 [Candidatus Uhrbacteria bacterium CG_4_10_14_0_2_um_filter_41_7]|uniref:Uncharacterized protein n=1 Tax=Candidatus Uhrbacteria bacterium CG_4_9_14_3_um_filter_41_35 TaxID=1975034 RepID=A0A2M7XDC8_9BACT|nr:MAG: hypothetical protein COV92_03610 [Candidatus Uhrbacteria bacterium CG11_big_fil_rev_8_21_14_0_20_41_9]PIZ53642.1 MAG: hypothetical protein COY25_03215 [Candidatus Uhrbacteria bacterium CG_4_10_14_0_2_um_filter_41_7]PJA45891.1 MAG: hypothetical protein CO173_04230 [Candidatus Uhrbacteria bacterium CG_4_9_14_3_um_filter_41_35]
MQRLNIPIENNTTRQKHWRVVWLVLLSLGTLIIGLYIQRWFFTANSTTGLRTADTTSSIRLLKTYKNSSITHTHLGTEQILPGAPWTVDNILAISKKEIALHFSKNTLIGLSIDTNLPDYWKDMALSYGYKVTIENNRSLIAKNDTDTLSEPKIRSFHLLNPAVDGEIVNYGAEPSYTNFFITKVGVVINQKSHTSINPINVFLPKDATVYAKVLIEPLDIASAQPFLNSAGINNQALVNLIKDEGAQITFGTDALGQIFNIAILNNNIDLDKLAIIGKELINRQTLSTTAWTTTDGSRYEEIRAQTSGIESSIDSNQDYSFITLKNQSGNQIRIIKTLDQITISNRAVSGEISQFSPVSTCLLGAHSYIKPGEMNDLLRNKLIFTPKSEQVFASLNLFSEIAISNEKVKFCW